MVELIIKTYKDIEVYKKAFFCLFLGACLLGCSDAGKSKSDQSKAANQPKIEKNETTPQARDDAEGFMKIFRDKLEENKSGLKWDKY